MQHQCSHQLDELSRNQEQYIAIIYILCMNVHEIFFTELQYSPPQTTQYALIKMKRKTVQKLNQNIFRVSIRKLLHITCTYNSMQHMKIFKNHAPLYSYSVWLRGLVQCTYM